MFLAAVESREIDCADLRSNPTMGRSTSCLVEREQKAESHLVTLHKGKARELRTSEGLRSRRRRNQNIRNEQSKLLLDWGRRFTEASSNRG